MSPMMTKENNPYRWAWWHHGRHSSLAVMHRDQRNFTMARWHAAEARSYWTKIPDA